MAIEKEKRIAGIWQEIACTLAHPDAGDELIEGLLARIAEASAERHGVAITRELFEQALCALETNRGRHGVH